MRVTVRISYIDAVFDFDDPMEGYNFAKSVQDHFNPNAGDKDKVVVTMSFIPEDEDKIGNDDDE